MAKLHRAFGLQSRIIALFVALMLLAQGGGVLLLSTAGVSAARKTIGDELDTGERVFHRLIEQRTVQLTQSARIVSADFAFREAIASNDRETVESVLHNHGDRIGAAFMMVLGLDGRIVADTHEGGVGKAFAHPRLLASAVRDGQVAAMLMLDDGLYQVVLVPVLAPLPIAWLAMGFAVNDSFAGDLSHLTGLQVSFGAAGRNGAWSLQASTLSTGVRMPFARLVETGALRRDLAEVDLAGEQYLTRLVDMPATDADEVVAALQEPLEAALAPFRRLQRQLTLVSIVSVLLCAAASVFIAGGIARPVRHLANVARRIAAGDYSVTPPAHGADEIRDLGNAFRTMQEGLAARESRILELAYRDTLTGLPNRALFADRLQQALAAAARAGAPMGVLLMDVDHFKYVNDTLGHPIGDMLLREMAQRLLGVARRETDTVARLGGDEFVVLLPGVAIEGARTVARQVLTALEAPMSLDGHVVDCRVSIGIASYPEHGDTTAALLRHADVAMYTAKRNQIGISVYDPQDDEHGRERLSLMSELRRAVEHNQLTL
ncbi:MAG TPA: diguanylate cyclase, partial [Casimicrobiaceae bacterium]|nr:diguanylate cyclase [Casimicrobiaceae bacterium]